MNTANTAVDYHWHLRRLMAERGLYNTTALRPLLAQRGVTLSASQIYRLVTEKPERLSLTTLVTLVEILGCTLEDLIEIVPVKSQKKAAGAGGPTRKKTVRATDVGELRPVRAKIIDTDS
jgi:DNA-binding Xre family transcriptional regulator